MSKTTINDDQEHSHENTILGKTGTDIPVRQRQQTKLVAIWTDGQDLSLDNPAVVIWEDGAPATVEDLREHVVDTHYWVETPSGSEKHMFPDIVGKVTFEQNVCDWVVRGEYVATTALNLNDPNASDGDIVGALFMLAMYYKSTIMRS